MEDVAAVEALAEATGGIVEEWVTENFPIPQA
jgi:hypothetical protein